MKIVLAYQAIAKGTITPVDPMTFKAQKGTDPDDPDLIEELSSPQSEQCT